MTTEVKTEKPEVEILNPLSAAIKAENIEIHDSELENLNIEDDTDKKDKAEDKEEKGNLDLVDDDTELEESEEESDEEKDNEPKDKEKLEAQEEAIAFSEDYKAAKNEMANLSDRITDLIDEVEILKPEKPSDEDDEELQEAYRQDLRDYQRQVAIANKKIARIQDQIKENAKTLQAEFIKNHSKENLADFENWMRKRQGFMAEFLSGKEDLETFYYLYKKRNGGTKLATVKKLSKGIKQSIDINSSAAPVNKGGNNGLPKDYKFANKPMFKNYVKDLIGDMRKGKPMPDGTKITYKLIDDLCKQEYQLHGLNKYE